MFIFIIEFWQHIFTKIRLLREPVPMLKMPWEWDTMWLAQWRQKSSLQMSYIYEVHVLKIDILYAYIMLLWRFSMNFSLNRSKKRDLNLHLCWCFKVHLVLMFIYWKLINFVILNLLERPSKDFLWITTHTNTS